MESKQEVKIDDIDKRILYELDLNGRATFSEIGKAVRLSKQAVKERIKKLEEKSIIRQYFALVDIQRLGYTFYRVDFRFHDTTKDQEKEILDYILKMPKVIAVIEIHGEWDLAVLFLTKNIVEIDDKIREIRWKFNKHIQNSIFSVATTHSRYKYDFLTGEKSGKEIFMGREMQETKLTPIENKALSILSENGRKPLTEISRETGKSISSVKNAIKNLKRKKILLGYSVLIDLQLLGYTHHKLFINFQNPTEEKENKLLGYFRTQPNIIFMTKSLGRSDIECEIVTKGVYEFKEIMREMKQIFPDLIRDFETYTVLRQYLTNYYPI